MSDDLLQRYFLQSDELPSSVKDAFDTASPGEKIRAYAFCDLVAGLTFGQRWVILGDRCLAIADPDAARSNGHRVWKMQTIALVDIEKFELLEGLSSSRLNLVGKNSKLLCALHFTRRQSRAMGNL